jgi:Domain of unknown function (DUF1906)
VKGADWSVGQMDYLLFKTAGYDFAMRYAVPTLPGKSLTHAEITVAHAMDVSVGFIYETTGTTWRGGHVQGMIDGHQAKSALAAMTVPVGRACYHAIDEQVTPADLGQIGEWVSGLIAGMWPYAVGVYGQYLVMQYLHVNFPDVKLWQTPAWSGGQTSDHINLLQGGRSTFDGVDIDADTWVAGDPGFWSPIVAPPPSPQLEDQDMIVLKVTAPEGQAWSGTRTFLYSGPTIHHIVSGEDNGAFTKALTVVTVSWEQFLAVGGASVPVAP